MKLPPLQLGDVVGSYRLVARLGHGATGRVYHAVQESSGTDVALKIIGYPDWAADDAEQQREIWQRFDREVSVCRQLSHPHVVRLIDSGSHAFNGDSFPWLSMQLIAGARSISDVYRENPNRDWLLDRAEEILDTLVYVHGLDIIHRDIKPDNVLIGSDGQLVLVDFGLVRVLQVDRDRLTRTGQAMGTVQYMALEQMGSAKHCDHRADLYSVGMVLFELLEGVKRWADVLPDIMCAGGIHFTADLPEPLIEFVTRLTAPNRERRYPSAAEALSTLKSLRRDL